MSDLRFSGVTKKFGAVTAVDNVSLEIADKEFVTLLGPSGCGKTTTLRMIAGFIQPDEGEITLDGRVLTSQSSKIFVQPEDRRMAMVFQNYALWPHMTVIENIMFGLRSRGIPKKRARAHALEALSLVRLEEMSDRYPHQLSGGQQQRISLARALACEPTVLLMDEPLSNLDAKFRESMRIEIKELHQKLGVTSIYVTHDQSEAIVMSDRICVMWEGRILQTAGPMEIYQRPVCTEVAEFIGQTNFLPGIAVEGGNQGLKIETKWGCFKLPDILSDIRPGQKVTVSIRPEHISLSKDRALATGEDNVLTGRITSRIFLGNFQEYLVDLKDQTVRVQAAVTDEIGEGEIVSVVFNPNWIAVIEE